MGFVMITSVVSRFVQQKLHRMPLGVHFSVSWSFVVGVRNNQSIMRKLSTGELKLIEEFFGEIVF